MVQVRHGKTLDPVFQNPLMVRKDPCFFRRIIQTCLFSNFLALYSICFPATPKPYQEGAFDIYQSPIS